MEFLKWYCTASLLVSGVFLLVFAYTDLMCLLGFAQPDPKFGYSLQIKRRYWGGFGIGWYMSGAWLPFVNMVVVCFFVFAWMPEEKREKILNVVRTSRRKKELREQKFVRELIESTTWFSGDQPPEIIDRANATLRNSYTELPDGYVITMQNDNRLTFSTPNGIQLISREAVGLEAYLLRHYIVEGVKNEIKLAQQ